MALTVAVTGPTGEIGVAAVNALEADAGVGRIIGMARRPFDPKSRGWSRRGNRGAAAPRPPPSTAPGAGAVGALVAGAAVVVHLAYVIFGSREESRRVNLDGTRNVFEAAVASPSVRRL